MGHIMMTTLPHVWNVGLSPLSLWFDGDLMVPSPDTAAGTVAWNSPCGMTWAVPSVSVLMSAPAVTSLSDWLADELWLLHIGRILMLICWLMLYLFFCTDDNNIYQMKYHRGFSMFPKWHPGVISFQQHMSLMWEHDVRGTSQLSCLTNQPTAGCRVNLSRMNLL